MTREQWAEMSSIEKRTLIAKLCGWTEVQPQEVGHYCVGCGYDCKGLRGMPPKAPIAIGVPDYLNDLNAMHQAEQMLIKRDNYLSYEYTLADICGNGAVPQFETIHATAEQKAEAFALTMSR